MDSVLLIVQRVLDAFGLGSRYGLWRVLVLSVAVLTIAVSHSAAADLGVAKNFFAADLAAVVEEAGGMPPSAVVRAGDGRVLGYAFSTREVSGSVGYSGRPLDIVAPMRSRSS